ncbi:protein arginine kinase activator [Anoxybacillus pushchinoensis]|uniref:Protein arginine kinase activator n=1 Tax=Anoxybacillus pushchinoensis TaxID=150248 RepID=A0A1I0T2X4_9BACL|nr:UvrB/UvrC motif-containing protein [Anoxybacillus pushchinoensis]SFA46148.1 protein arginine kinase activator [Anoxybacillus pushchinoensis]
MICQECNQRPATLHFTKIVNGEKTEIHLCEQCAHEKGEMFMFPHQGAFSINNLIAGLLNMDASLKEQKAPSFHSEHVLQCERCKMTYAQFVKVGRFGCANCYETFAHYLPPVFRRLHGGHVAHEGKIPKRVGGTLYIRKQIGQLKHVLQDLIVKEQFEKAAEVRDQIRELETKLKAEGGASHE